MDPSVDCQNTRFTDDQVQCAKKVVTKYVPTDYINKDGVVKSSTGWEPRGGAGNMQNDMFNCMVTDLYKDLWKTMGELFYPNPNPKEQTTKQHSYTKEPTKDAAYDDYREQLNYIPETN